MLVISRFLWVRDPGRLVEGLWLRVFPKAAISCQPQLLSSPGSTGRRAISMSLALLVAGFRSLWHLSMEHLTKWPLTSLRARAEREGCVGEVSSFL